MDRGELKWEVWQKDVFQAAFDCQELAEEYVEMQEAKYKFLRFEVRRKEKEWKPKLGEEVEIVEEGKWGGRWGVVVAIEDRYCLLFNPLWTDGDEGFNVVSPSSGIKGVPGYNKSHYCVLKDCLRPIGEH